MVADNQAWPEAENAGGPGTVLATDDRGQVTVRLETGAVVVRDENALQPIG